MKKKNNKGFTLVELLVVIAIIGILAVVAVPSLVKNINKANASDVTSYISAVKTQAMAMYADGSYEKGVDESSDINTMISDIPDPTDADLKSVTIDDAGNIVINIWVKNADIKTYVATQLGINITNGSTGDNSTTINITTP